jgi:hypothetical protein
MFIEINREQAPCKAYLRQRPYPLARTRQEQKIKRGRQGPSKNY